MRVDIDICVLPDGRVVFGDLTPELREVADVLTGANDIAKTADAAPASNATVAAEIERGPSP
jgi:hypothetical protein